MKKVNLFIHPGEILKEEFLEPMGINASTLSIAINIEKTRLYNIINGKRAITADTDIRLSRFFKTSIGYWLRIQNKYDLDIAQSELSESDNQELLEFQMNDAKV